MISKVNPFLQFFKAIKSFFSPKEFYELRKQSTGSKIAYVFIISIVASFLYWGISGNKLANSPSLETSLNQMPEFSYANGSLKCEQQYELTSNNSYLVIDTSVDHWNPDFINLDSPVTNETTGSPADINVYLNRALHIQNVNEIMLVSKNNVVMYEALSKEATQISNSEFFGLFGIHSFSKSMIMSGYKSFIIKWAFIAASFFFLFFTARIFWNALLYSLIGLIVNAATGSQKSFSTLYWISFYLSSVFCIVRAIVAPFTSLSGFFWFVLLVLLYSIYIYIILKSDDPTETPSASYGGANYGYTPVNDTYETPYTTPSAFDLERNSQVNPAPSNTPDTSGPTASPFSTAEQTTSEATKSSISGLSLKSDD